MVYLCPADCKKLNLGGKNQVCVHYKKVLCVHLSKSHYVHSETSCLS